MVFVFAVMGFAALVASCGQSGSKVIQEIGGSTSKGAKTDGSSSLNDEEHELELIRVPTGMTDDAYGKQYGERLYDGDEDSGNVPNMRKDSRDYYY